MAFDLLSIGDVSIDQYMRINNAEVIGEPDNGACKICFEFSSKIPVDNYQASIAGNACNNVLACTKLGMNSTIYTEFGDDANADLFIKTFKNSNINTKYCIKNKNSPTNVHTILVHEGERTIFSYHEQQQYKIRKWEDPKWLYYTSICEGFDGFQQELVEYLKEKPHIGVAFNPGTFHLKAGLERLRNILEVTDVLFVNTREAKMLVGDTVLEKLHSELQNLGPKLTVITDGKNGCSASDRNSLVRIGILTDLRHTLDKTGAGDAHSAGVLAALHNGKSLEEALKWGAINSSNVIRQVGSINGLVTLEEIEELMGHNPSFENPTI